MRIDESRTATNLTTGSAAGRGAPTEIVIHHWGIDGQSHGGVVNWFCTPGNSCGTSAHFVASSDGISCIVSTVDVAWHAGDWPVNLRSIGIECRPEATAADYAAVAWLISYLRGLYGDLPLRPHKLYALTDCPGRYDLARLDRMARGTIAIPQSGNITPIKEDTLSAAEVTQIKNHINAVLLGPYTWDDGKHPKGVRGDILAAVNSTPEKVWAETVDRSGKKISVKQELADAKTEAQALRAAVVALAKNPGLDAAQITEAVRAGIADGTVTVDVTVAGAK